jgi:hypothetical protein
MNLPAWPVLVVLVLQQILPLVLVVQRPPKPF